MRSIFLVVFASALIFQTQIVVFAGEWSMFRGNRGAGVTPADSRIPTEWSEKLNVTWKVEIPGLGWSSPVEQNGKLFFATAVKGGDEENPELSLRGISVDSASGKTDWDVELFYLREWPKIHGKNSYASPTPVVEGDRVYFHFGPYGTAATNLAGKPIWKTQEFPFDPMHGNGGSPALVDDLLVFSCDGLDERSITAIDKNSGKLRWRTKRTTEAERGFSFGTPLLITHNGRKQIINQASNQVAAYDPSTGDEIWKARYDGFSCVPLPVFDEKNGLVFICTGYEAPTMIAVAVDGTGDVTDTHIKWTVKRAAPLNPAPLFLDERLYTISDAGIATCWEPTTGKVIWQQRVGGNFTSSPIAVGNRIFLTDESGRTTVIQAGPRYKELARNQLSNDGEEPERSFSTIAVVDGALFIRLEKHLYRIEAQRKVATSE
jgi:outer membrane protein assembly factor BamB